MNFKSKFSLTLVFSSTALLPTACAAPNAPVGNEAFVNKTNDLRNMNQSTASEIEIKTDLAELEKIINLPVRPSEVKWTQEIFDNSKGAVAAPSDKRLTVLLKYDEKSAAELSKKITPEIAETSLGSAEIKNWFPDEVKKQAQTGDGKIFLEGAKFPVNAFARQPYSDGKLIRVGNSDYFVLNLFSF